jgi:hypothetical protein
MIDKSINELTNEKVVEQINSVLENRSSIKYNILLSYVDTVYS